MSGNTISVGTAHSADGDQVCVVLQVPDSASITAYLNADMARAHATAMLLFADRIDPPKKQDGNS